MDRANEAHHLLRRPLMGIASLHPSYGLSYFNRCFRRRFRPDADGGAGEVGVYFSKAAAGSAIKTSDNLTQLAPRIRVTM
jgi:hypothetical protein